MNAGGDQGRDDYGLPPVDIEVPDDARELARDVQAYHRELRSRRRRHLARRLYGPLTRDGMVLPLLAGCLALTLVAATLLTVFTARQPTVGLRPQRPATGTGSQAPARPGAALVKTILFAGGPGDAAGHPPRPGGGTGADPAPLPLPGRPEETHRRGGAGRDVDLPGGRAQRPGEQPDQEPRARGHPGPGGQHRLAARALQGGGADGGRGPPGRYRGTRADPGPRSRVPDRQRRACAGHGRQPGEPGAARASERIAGRGQPER